ncbi:beta-2 adrenergic receptor-like [Dendronephthya gigantea]|uniref:beta-2 adrenergic receptor-like n=1 Tax=Dendronephthya gigantea TaxID=151771 RepID=UPI0010693A00|nr:beta-2 adrenergic receptor-like [Dendronephthya gigantea]
MNLSGKPDSFETKCFLLGTTSSEFQNLPSDEIPENYNAVIVINIIFIIPAIIFNAVPIITIWKSSQLRSKPCYFIVLILSVIDLAVGVLGIPLFVAVLIVSVLNGGSNCFLSSLAFKIASSLFGLSRFTFIAMTAERYIAILHPYKYTTLVTKKRLLIFVCSTSAIHIIFTAFSATFDDILVIIYSALERLLTIGSITFAYTRICLVVRKLARSVNRPQDLASVENRTRRKAFLQEIKRAKSCFKVVMCSFTIVLFPSIAFRLYYQSKLKDVTIFIWIVTLGYSVSIVDSVIFFWTKTMLRKEAVKKLKTMR